MRRRRESEFGMLVGLLKPGHEAYDLAVRQARKTPRMNRKREVEVHAAFHAPIAHVLGEPCIKFAPTPNWKGYHRYPLVHEKNVIPILAHESVHCTIQRLLDLGPEQKFADRAFDAFFGMLKDTKRAVGL